MFIIIIHTAVFILSWVSSFHIALSLFDSDLTWKNNILSVIIINHSRRSTARGGGEWRISSQWGCYPSDCYSSGWHQVKMSSKKEGEKVGGHGSIAKNKTTANRLWLVLMCSTCWNMLVDLNHPINDLVAYFFNTSWSSITLLLCKIISYD